jgi:CRP/FNR family transcriptional regulator, cyclic AMP receptor protein
VAVIPRREFEELIHEDPRIANRFIRLLAKNIVEKESKLVGIAYNSLRKKVAEALLMLRRKYLSQKEQRFSINLNREDLANIAGTATESLIRTLSDFKSEKLIDISRDGTITILDERKLSGLFN